MDDHCYLRIVVYSSVLPPTSVLQSLSLRAHLLTAHTRIPVDSPHPRNLVTGRFDFSNDELVPSRLHMRICPGPGASAEVMLITYY